MLEFDDPFYFFEHLIVRIEVPVPPASEGDINTFAYIFLAECKTPLELDF